MIELKQHVETLISSASKANDSNEAMRFAQAALNAAQAIHVLHSTETAKAA